MENIKIISFKLFVSPAMIMHCFLHTKSLRSGATVAAGKR